MRTITRIVLVALIVFTGGCDALVGSDDDNFTFSAVQLQFQEGMTNEATVAAVIGSILIDGVILLPSSCYRVSGALRQNNSQYDVTVNASSTNATCPAAVQAMQYRFQLFSVTSGLYRVNIYHDISGQQRQLISTTDVSVGR